MEEKPNYYAVIPAEVRYNKKLRANEKLLFGEITALSSANGECTASNNYFSELYGVVPSAISKWIKDLEEEQYIDVEYLREGKEIKKRIIRIIGSHKYDKVFTKIVEGYSQKLKENNTSINNIKENIKRKVFTPPSLDEIKKYIQEKNLRVDAKQFYDYFSEGNWIDSKGNKVKNWKQKLLTWNKFNQGVSKEKQEYDSISEDLSSLYDN